MTPDYRALCAELVKDFDDLRESSEGVAGFHRNGDLAPWEELSVSGRYPWLSSFDRARALLAEPVDEGLTDEELDELFTEIDQGGECLSWRAYARAVLARWGRPAAAPVPVSERLPGPEDCDGEGRYWGLVLGCEAWALAKGNPRLLCITHWLPAYALPLPAPEVQL